jgi:hypothetical protein
MTNWMLVSSPENFERIRALGFPFLAMKSRHIRKAEKVAPGDRVVFYAVGVMGFAGTFEVTSPYYESHDPLFVSKRDNEDYPYRFSVKPVTVLPTGSFVPAIGLLPRLDWVKKWPADHWHLAFQGNVHVLSDADFQTIEDSLRAVPAPVSVS